VEAPGSETTLLFAACMKAEMHALGQQIESAL
jgi:hypothetical protein